MPQRLTYIDIAKGIGIFLVVIGHCIPDAASAIGISITAYRWLHDIIYSFHMPLFFYLAGFMVSSTKRLGSRQNPFLLVKKRVSRLLVPYIFVGLCYAPFKMLLSKFANKPYDINMIWQMVIGVNPDGELWFLYSLFVITCIAAIFSFRISKLGLILAALILVWNPWGIISNYLFFFLFGIYMRRDHSELISRLTCKHILWLCITFLVSIYGLHIMKWHWCFLLTSITGILMVLKVAFWLSTSNISVKNMLEYWGIISMDIYILSDIIKIPFRIVLWNKFHLYHISFVICTIASIVLSIVVSKYVVRKNNFLQFLVLGINKNK